MPKSSPILSEDKYRNFIENLPVLFYAVQPSPPYTPLYVSPAFSRFGYEISEWMSDPDIWERVIHPQDHKWVFDQTTASTKSGEEVDYEYRIVDANGMVHWVRDRGCLIRDKKGQVVCREGVILDITDRKRVEEDLILGEERFRNIFDNASDIIYVHDLDGNYVSINGAGERIFGYNREETLLMNVSEVAVPEHLDLVKQHISNKLDGSSKQTSYDLDCFRKDGQRITLEVNSSVISKDGVAIAIQGIARDVTERKRAEAAIRENEEKYRELFENANDLIYTHDLAGNFTSINRAGEMITGYSRDEAITMNVIEVVAEEHIENVKRMISSKVKGGNNTAYELEIIAKNGKRVSLDLSTRLIYQGEEAIGVQGIGRDITERRRAEEALKTSEQRYRQLGEGILHQIWTARPDGRLDYVNKRTLEYFDRNHERMLGDGWKSAVHPDDIDETIKRWMHSLETGEPYETEFRLCRHDGQYRWHVAKATAGRDATGKITKWFGTNTDIHEQKESEEKLNYYARHDTLTDLPNRAEFMIQLRQSIERGVQNSNSRFAVIFLDLDRFKIINDSLGHVVGDKLLIAIASRLKAAVRPGDIVARLGGDEFTILLNRTGTESDISKVVERIQRKLSHPFNIDNYEVFTTASVGVVLSDERKREADDYLRDADSAMYRAKEGGKARYEFFDRDMHVRNMNQLQLETDLRHAVERNEFEVYYQPIVELSSGSITEFEALIRWRHPKHGMVSPLEFVGVAEETGLIIPIGKWVIKESCRQLALWQKESAERLSVSVNLSAKQLMHPSLTAQVADILRDNGLDAKQLKLEVTESTVMGNSERALAVLTELDELGIQLSTDDFGTGYSSLSYLQRFPFDRLKIDRSFIDKLGEDKKSDAIVKTILMLGNNLGMEVVAEGIENEKQLEMLRQHGCAYGQGYFFSCPVSAKEAGNFLNKEVQDGAFAIPDQIVVEDQMLEFTTVQ